MFCPNCGNQVEDGSRFCGFCGNRFGPQPFRPTQAAPAPIYTEQENDAFFTREENDAFFTREENDTFFAQQEQPPMTFAPQPPTGFGGAPGGSKPPFRLSKKSLIIGAAAAAALLLIVVVVVIAGLSASGGAPSYALYLKDSQIFYNGLSGEGSSQVTDDLTDGEDVEDPDLRSAASDLGDVMHLTEDGKTLFYMDEIGEEGTLYSRSVANFEDAPVAIASGVEEYAVCDGGKLLFYLKSGTLHRCKSPFGKENDEKIARDVAGFSVTEDGGYVLYEDEDGVWYMIHKGGEEKLGSGIDIQYVGDKGTVYYSKGDNLYAKAVGKDREKLLSDVDSMFGFTMKGTFYFTRSEELTLADFFADDSEYEYWMDNFADEEFIPYSALYYYNGKEEVLLTEGCYDRLTSYYSGEKMAVYYTAVDIASLSKLSYQELEALGNSDEYYYTSIYEVAQIMIREALEDAAASCIVIDGTVSQVDVENVSDFVCSPDCRSVYFLCDVDEEREEGTACKASVSGGKVGKPEKFDDDVYSRRGFYFVGGSDYFIYYKDVQNNEGELFVNGESVDEDVYTFLYGITYNAQKDSLLYMTDYDTDRFEGTLRIYNGRKAADISDDVSDFTIASNGDVVFRYDFSMSKYEGTLAVYDGKVTDISDDVFNYTVTPGGDVLFLYDYNISKSRGNLAAYTGKVTELDEDVVALITITEGYYHSFDR